MSEIKGQILGVVLVLAIFGAIGASLLSAFKTSASNVTSKITDEEKLLESTSDNSNVNPGSLIDNNLFDDAELLTF